MNMLYEKTVTPLGWLFSRFTHPRVELHRKIPNYTLYDPPFWKIIHASHVRVFVYINLHFRIVMANKGPVKLMKRANIAHSFL